ncbi:MAG: hypothetical protein O7F74_07640, partial [Bacteroidetes bacterium]|nr:hypothetical protein [Bacteroidota bacterium]
LVLVASSGFVVNQHYCKGELKTSALFKEAKTCQNHQQTVPSCPLHQKPQNHQKDCCKNQSQEFKADDFENTTQLVVNLDNNLPTSFLRYILIQVSISTVLKPTNFQSYQPPLIAQDLTLQVQSFLL